MLNALIKVTDMKWQNVSAGLLFFTLLSQPVLAVSNLSIPNEPLTVLSSRVDPNVMMVIDNSGSMNNVIWHEDYDPTTIPNSDYTAGNDWIYRNDNGSWYYINNRGDYTLSNIRRESGWYVFAFYDGSFNQVRVKLPDPVGGRSSRYNGHYIKWVLDNFASTYQTNLESVLPNEYRMVVAKTVAQSIVDDVEDVRFGITKFYNNEGGKIVAECGAGTSTLHNAIDDLDSETWTPLSETYYEVTRYFRGLRGIWGSRPYFNSPIQYRCQKNFTVIITDGAPTEDDFENKNISGDTIVGIPKVLPDWNNDGSSLYLDDIAEFAWELDMKTSGNDNAGVSYNDPEFEQQNLYTYTVGFALDHPLLKASAEAGNGRYYTANNAEQLTAVLKSALADISDKVLSSAASASTQGTLTQDTVSIFPEYNSQYWSGNLSAYRYDIDPSSSTYLQLIPAWTDAADLIPSWSSRRIVYNRGNQGRAFRWNTLNTEERGLLENDENVLNYIRGDRSQEGVAANNFRERRSVLGDIVYSAPKYVGVPAFRYPNDLEADSYADFKEDNKNRDEMIYVGANDGMLHAFDVNTGVERFAFIPSNLMSKLSLLTKQTYEHRFYVDGSPTVVDAYVSNNWKSVLVSGLNRGGQSVFALDVTNPANLSESNANNVFMWEFTDPDLGYSYSQPAIVKLSTGEWAAVFGNGYNNTDSDFDDEVSSTGNAVLFVVDLETGALIKKIDTGVGFDDDPTNNERPNGLATVAPIDFDSDNIIDYIYAGDLFGNLWKFDLTSDKANQWDVAYTQDQNKLPLFTACNGNTCTSSNRQPITVRPTVSRHPKGGFLVFFGTGKYLETVDKTAGSTDGQSFYAVWDKNEGSNSDRVSSRSSMREQNVLYEGVQTYGSESYTLRTTSKHEPNWSSHRGWYMDLPTTRERSTRNPILRNGKIIFTTLIPLIQEDPCKSESEGWLMELDAITGSALSYSVFDLNKDGRFDGLDVVSGGRGVPSGMKFDQEIVEPTIIAIDENTELKVINKDTVITENPGTGALGRQSWREHY
jgi:type IV pilus assembly protein PilY1